MTCRGLVSVVLLVGVATCPDVMGDVIQASLLADGEVRDFNDDGIFDALGTTTTTMRLIDNLIGSYRPIMLFDLSAVEVSSIESVTLKLYVQGRTTTSSVDNIMVASGDAALTLADYSPGTGTIVGQYNSNVGLGPQSFVLDLSTIKALRGTSPYLNLFFGQFTSAQSTFYSSEFSSFDIYRPTLELGVSSVAVPEPSCFALLGIGAIGLISYRIRKQAP